MQLFENILDFKINLEKFNNESIDNSAKVFGKFSIELSPKQKETHMTEDKFYNKSIQLID